jgi:hypothetical protein
MKRARAVYLFTIVTSLVVLLFPGSSVTHSEKSSATVKVDCSKGESINEALTKQLQAQKLTIEISGMCHENVVVIRDGVTFHGIDPANDGIQAKENAEITDPVLWVRGATLTSVENLTLTGGFSGLLATNANLPNLRVTNCRLTGNIAFGIQLENSLATATDTTFESVGPGAPAGVFLSSRLACNHCTLIAPASGVNATLTTVNSIVNFGQQSTFTGGPIRSEGSSVGIADSTINVSATNVPSVNSVSNSSVNMTRVQVTGRLFFQGSNAVLLAVTQGALGAQPNQATLGSQVTVGAAGQPGGGPPNINSTLAKFDINNFSNLILNQGSTIDGDLVCRFGGNAYCVDPANVTGATNCALCPKP